jgi:hypothetical protein
MGALIVFGIVITAVVVFDLLAVARGVDSRPGFDGMSRTPDRVIPA